MTAYYVDSNATGGTNAGTSWTDAYLSFWSIPSLTLATTDIVYVASNHVDADPGASKTLTGPTGNGLFARIISATSGTTTYAAGAQIKTTGGAYAMRFDNSLSFYGCTFVSGAAINFRPASTTAGSVAYCFECTFKPASGGTVGSDALHYATVKFVNCTFDYSADTLNSGAGYFTVRGPLEIYGGIVVKGGTYNRSGIVLDTSSARANQVLISGLDLSVIGSTNDLFNGGSVFGKATYYGCKLPSSWSLQSADITNNASLRVFNCGDGDDPRIYYLSDQSGKLTYQTSIYRSSGAAVETGVTSWRVVTTSVCSESFPFITDWLYGTIDTAGTKTFTLHVANNTEDLHDDDIWLEVEYMGTADLAHTTFASDQRAGGAANASASTTAQTDDTGSTWNGATLTYMQKLEIASVSVGEAGVYRARVCVGKPSLTVYIDPKVTVS